MEVSTFKSFVQKFPALTRAIHDGNKGLRYEEEELIKAISSLDVKELDRELLSTSLFGISQTRESRSDPPQGENVYSVPHLYVVWSDGKIDKDPVYIGHDQISSSYEGNYEDSGPLCRDDDSDSSEPIFFAFGERTDLAYLIISGESGKEYGIGNVEEFELQINVYTPPKDFADVVREMTE